MRRIFDLNQVGFLFLRVIGLFVIAVPASLYGISRVVSKEVVRNNLIQALKASFILGVCLTTILLILIIAEQIQDYYFDAHYQKNRNQKIQLADGNYECQYCGNQNVKEYDKICRVCSRELKQPGKESSNAQSNHNQAL